MWIRVAAFLFLARCFAADGIVVSIAGVGPSERDLVSGRAATDAVLGEVHALYVDSDGGLLIGAQRLLVRVNPEGRAEPLVGPGTLNISDGLAGDRVAAEDAPVAYLRGVARAADGSVYFSDAGLQSVRRLGTDGTVETVVPYSAGYVSPRALVFDPSGNLYFAALGRRDEEVLRGLIVKVTPEGRIEPLPLRDTEGRAVFLNQPEGLAFDASGALYATEYGGHRVRKIVDGVITTIAGTGKAGFSGDGGPAAQAEINRPSGVAVVADGTVFIADTLNNCIRVVSPAGIVSTLRWTTDQGQTEERVAAPAHIRFDAARQALYVAEYFGRRVSRIESGRITSVAGNGERMTETAGVGDGGPALLANLRHPEGIALCRGTVYIADTSNFLLRAIASDGSIRSVAGTGRVPEAGQNGGSAIETAIMPAAVACDGAGNVYIADRGRPRIWKMDVNGGIAAIAGDGSFQDPELHDPRGIAVDSAGNVFVAERSYSRFLRIAADGGRTVLWSGRENVDFPYAVAVDPQGRPCFSVKHAEGGATVWRIEDGGDVSLVAESGESCGGTAQSRRTGLCFVSGLAFDANGTLFLSTADRIARVDANGAIEWIAGAGGSETGVPPLGDRGPALAAWLNGASGIAVDRNAICVTQLLYNRVRRISRTD